MLVLDRQQKDRPFIIRQLPPGGKLRQESTTLLVVRGEPYPFAVQFRMRNRLADVVRCRSKGQKRVGPFILEGLIHDAEVVLEQRRPMAIPAVGVRVCLQVAQQLVNQREMMAGHVTRQLCLDRLELHRVRCGHGRDGEIHATKLAPGLRSITTHDPADQHHHEDDQRPHAHAANQPGPDSIDPGHHRLCGG